jgi:threonine dehydratase
MYTRNLVNKYYNKISKYVINTPLQYNERLSKIYNSNIFLKREDLQNTRSFKIRGVIMKLQLTRSFKIRGVIMKLQLTDFSKNKSIVCSSAGNHAQSIAHISNILNIPCNIFLPQTVQQQKVNRIKKYSNPDICKIHLYGNVFDECLEESKIFSEKNNSLYIHPFDDIDILTGQGSIGYEIEKEKKDMDIIIASIGGGGLISGISSYYKNDKHNKIKIYGVESENNDSMKISVENNKITKLDNDDSFVDGSAVKQPGSITYEICKKYVDKYYKVSNNRVCYDLYDLYQDDGIVAELSGAMPISVLHKIKDDIKSKNVCCVISGGNNDLLRLNEIYNRKLIYENKLHYFIIKFAQKPGILKEFINNITKDKDDIVRFEYLKKNDMNYGNVLIGINTDNIHKLLEKLDSNKYDYTKLDNEDKLFKYIV